MNSLLSSLLFILPLVGLARGAPTQIATKTSDNCSWWKYVRDDLRCLPEIITFVENIGDPKYDLLEKESQIKKMHEMCIPLQQCFSTTECHSTQLGNLKDVCEAMVLLESPKYKVCLWKMRFTGRECPKGDECDIFGPDNCDKDDMVEACGHNEWVNFRDVMLKVYRTSEKAAMCNNYKHLKDL